MPKASNANRGSLLIKLEGKLTIYRAVELKDELLAAFDSDADLELELSGVTEIDVTGVQLLLLARRALAEQGRSLRLSGHSVAVQELLERIKLFGHFDDGVKPSS